MFIFCFCNRFPDYNKTHHVNKVTTGPRVLTFWLGKKPTLGFSKWVTHFSSAPNEQKCNDKI